MRFQVQDALHIACCFFAFQAQVVRCNRWHKIASVALWWNVSRRKKTRRREEVLEKLKLGLERGHAASATLDHLFLTSTWCEFYAAAVGLSSMLESSSGIIMLPPTRIASKCIQQGLSCSDCVIACLTSGYWCGRDGYWTVIQQHLNDMGIHLRYTYPIVFPHIPIVCHHIISYPFIQCSCHKYPWTKLHSVLSAGWGHHRRGSIAEARLCWGKALGTLKAYESLL